MGGTQPSQGFWDSLFALAREAFGDIRDKLVLEGWFGRGAHSPSKDGAGSGGAWQPQQPSFDELWGPSDARAPEQPSERDMPRMDL